MAVVSRFIPSLFSHVKRGFSKHDERYPEDNSSDWKIYFQKYPEITILTYMCSENTVPLKSMQILTVNILLFELS